MKNKKELGQNWLNNRIILDEIARLAVEGQRENVVMDDQGYGAEETSEVPQLCVEIGPGLGYLTSSLFKRFKRVIAVEFDGDLARKLPGSFPGKDLVVVNEDILRFDFESITESYVIAGNIPYYITSPIIKKVLTLKHRPRRIVLLVQKEVAERIVDNKETMLSLFVKNYAKASLGPIVKREEFTPPPKVDSRVVVMEPYGSPTVDDKVFDLIRIGFGMPRKKLVRNLAELRPKEKLIETMTECGISLDARPGDVRLEQWEELYKLLNR